MRHLLSKRFFAIAGLATASHAVPIFDVFGPFPEADFGGTGIPNDSVAQAVQFANGDDLITLALNATQRFSAPVVTNDGAGTFFAEPGTADPDGPGPDPEGSLWNFNFFIKIESISGAVPAPTLEDYQFNLFYDVDPTAGIDFGVIDLTASVAAFDPGATIAQGSQNLLFSFLSTPSPLVTPPAGTYDPNATGEYVFALTASTLPSATPPNFPIESAAIVVEVPEPSGAIILAMVALGVVLYRRPAWATLNNASDAA